MEGYILHWQEQVCLFHDLVKVKEGLPESVLMMVLQNAVFPSPELRAVKTQGHQLQTTTGKALNYEQYLALLTSVAQYILNVAQALQTQSIRLELTRWIHRDV